MQPEPIREFGEPRENEERRDGGCAIVFDQERKKYAIGYRASDGVFLLFSGGVEPGERIEGGILRELREESGLYDVARVEKLAEALAHYHNVAKNVNRVAHATCLLVVLKSDQLMPTQLEAHEHFVLQWKTAAEIFENWQLLNDRGGFDHWVYFLERAQERLAELGYVVGA